MNDWLIKTEKILVVFFLWKHWLKDYMWVGGVRRMRAERDEHLLNCWLLSFHFFFLLRFNYFDCRKEQGNTLCQWLCSKVSHTNVHLLESWERYRLTATKQENLACYLTTTSKMWLKHNISGVEMINSMTFHWSLNTSLCSSHGGNASTN